LSFEIREKALLGRIGRLKTKSGVVETPLLFPVVNPVTQSITPKRIRTEFGFEALITNAYILKKQFQTQPVAQGLHKFLDYDGVIMTDSGAYQILAYGGIDISPKEIVEYQESIGSDIATILDIPTGWKISEAHAEKTVKETMKRAKEFFNLKQRNDILWVGPVQGGKYLNLVAKSARETGKLLFDIHALGSPTEVMERYRFDVLVDMIMAAKMNLPIDRPLHLFGAGHPFMFALAVALGCDLFDSAAYALYARENRYMTENGTSRLNELEYFPCACPKCTKATPKQVQELPQKEKTTFLAEHNLYTCSAELKRIKQAIKDGRLWEHLEMRAHAHPALLQALKKLKHYEEYIEKHDPAVKNSGLFFFNSNALARPEIVRHRRRLKERYAPPKEAKMLMLVPQPQSKPFHRTEESKRIKKTLQHCLGKKSSEVHICFYTAPFGVVPTELDEVYPLSQHETAKPFDKETTEYVADQVANYINNTEYAKIILLNNTKEWGNTLLKTCKKASAKKKTKFASLNFGEQSIKAVTGQLERILLNI
jgi:7-cyano-7-deazaguanine tRNA-ribosyltransferase